MREVTGNCILTCVFLGGLVPALCLGAPGDLDPTFGTGGLVTTDFASSSDQAFAVAIQADGKIVAAGRGTGSTADFALARYNTDGSLDTTFGTGGLVTTDFASDFDQAFAVAIQADGKIVAAGDAVISGTFDFALARYNTDGSLDTTFGTGGLVTTDFASSTDAAFAVVIQADGKIVAAGEAVVTPGIFDFALVRYNTDGTLDTTFGTGGLVSTDFASGTDQAFTVAIQVDGKIVAAGRGTGSTADFALARYNTDGSLDTTFGTGGLVTTDFASGFDQPFAVAIQADGKIVAAGEAFAATTDFALARYNTDGSLDTAFGTGGLVTTGFGSGFDRADGVAIQGDGKIVAAGRAAGTSEDFALARYLVGGTCGNGIVDGGEACDDGGTADGDCCSATCQNEAAGSQTCGVGACEVTTGVCADGVPLVCAPGAPTSEICDGIDNDCDGIADEGFIEIHAATHTVGSGSHPGSTKNPLVGIEVCAYDKSEGSCVFDPCGGVSHQHYGCIALGDLDADGQPDIEPCDPVGCCTTDSFGECRIEAPPGDYIVISADATKTVLPDPLGVSASDLECGEAKQKHLQQIVRSDGKKMPGKTRRLTGSELLIIEPEFVVWDNTEQLYPFIFETVGDWGVTAAVAPPEGFVADNDSLSANVDNEIEAVQFVITEVGSELVATETTFETVHNGSQRTVHSNVGIMLTPGYAHSRGFDVVELRSQGLIYEVPDRPRKRPRRVRPNHPREDHGDLD